MKFEVLLAACASTGDARRDAMRDQDTAGAILGGIIGGVIGHPFVDGHAELFASRVHDGRIVEGHGDLRPEHVYLTDPPTIVDCIEFDRELRFRDPIDELAFLAMECDRLGHAEVDGRLFAAYAAWTGDKPARVPVEFHKALNAFVRAKTAVWHIDDPDTGTRCRWVACAADYLVSAHAYTDRLPISSA